MSSKGGSLGLGWMSFWVIFGVLGYFVYGKALDGALYAILLHSLLGISSLIGLIPFGGVLIYLYWLGPLVTGWVGELTGLSTTWLTGFIFSLEGIVSAILTLITTLLVIVASRR